jgi:hypothetical protein
MNSRIKNGTDNPKISIENTYNYWELGKKGVKSKSSLEASSNVFNVFFVHIRPWEVRNKGYI